MEFPRTSVITIQGGGAVAIDLIGQLQGLTGRRQDKGAKTKDKGLLPAAVAGTSAGAIIATLFWAGYSPEAIRDEMVRLFALSRVNALFGRGGGLLPIRFKGFAAVAAAVSAGLQGWRSLITHMVWSKKYWYLLPIWWLWQPLSLFSRSLAIVLALVRHRGIFPGDGLEKAIDRLLREGRVLKRYQDQLSKIDGFLRFDHVIALHDPNIPPLFLIITDVRGPGMIVVSSIDPACTELEIATAVRASAGVPFFFTPIKLSSHYDTCVDGGVISNFPAWVFGFDYRKSLRASGNAQLVTAAYMPWLHVGLRLSQDAAGSPDTFGRFLRAVFDLLTGRARALLDDKLAKVVPKRRSVKPSPPSAGTAPRDVFDFTSLSDPKMVNAAFERGRVDGQLAIEPDCFELPPDEDVKPILVDLADRARFLLRDWLIPRSRVRANIFIPQGGDLVLVYHANMDGDPDERIRFSHGQGISSLVYFRRATVVADLSKRTLWGPLPSTGRDPYLTGHGAPVILADRTWLLSMPLIDVTEMWSELPALGRAPLSPDLNGPTLGVLNVDAAIDYDRPEAPSPDRSSAHPAVLTLFEAMQSAGQRCSIVFNQRFLR